MDEIGRIFAPPMPTSGGVVPKLGRANLSVGRPGPVIAGFTRLRSIPPKDVKEPVSSNPTVLNFYTVTASKGTFVLTGVSANLNYGRAVVGTTRSYTLTGVGTTALKYGRAVQGTTRTYVLSGIAANLVYPKIIHATTQTYVMTGKTTGLHWGHVVHGTTRTYVLSGIAAHLVHDYPLHGVTQTYVLTGKAATLRPARKIAAGTTSYVLTPTATGLLRKRIMPAGTSSYILTGQAASLKRGKGLQATTQTYVMSGKDAGLLHKMALPADTRAYTLVGFDTGLRAARSFSITTKAFTLTGIAAGYQLARYIAAAPTSYVLTGKAANLLKHSPPLQAVTVSYVLTGQAASLLHGRPPLSAGTGSYSLTGIAAWTVYVRKQTATVTPFNLTGQAVSLRATRLLVESFGANCQYVLAGQAITFDRNRRLLANTVSYVITGKKVGLSLGGGTGRRVTANLRFLPRVAATLKFIPRVSAAIRFLPRVTAQLSFFINGTGGAMPTGLINQLAPGNDNVVIVSGVKDSLDATLSNGSPKFQDNATVTWEIRDAPQAADGTPGGVQVASGVAQVLTGGQYACLMSHNIAMLFNQGYYFRVTTTLNSGFVSKQEAPFSAQNRTGETQYT